MHRMLGTLLAAVAAAGCLGSRAAPLIGDAGSCATSSEPVAVSPLAVDFGSVVVESLVTRTVTLANCTDQNVGVTASLAGPQASLFSIDKGPPFTVPAGQSVDIVVSYGPPMVSALDMADLQLVFSSAESVTVPLHGVGVVHGLQISPIPLNFAFVQVGQSLTLPLHLTDIGNLPITVMSTTIVDPGTPAAFAISAGSWTAGNLAPGQSQDIPVTFTPTMAGKFDGLMNILSTDIGTMVPVALTGFGGGAILSCSPLALDFGSVAANVGGALPVTCTNTGTDVPNHPEAGVILSTLSADNPVFSAQVDPASMDPASSQQPLAAGHSVQIDVSYTPFDAGATDTGTLTINSNVTDGTSLAPPAVALKGTSVDAVPCLYTLIPNRVQFGQLQAGPDAIEGSGFTISNLGPNDCLVTGLDLSADTQSAFTLPNGPVMSQRLSAPGTTALYPSVLQVNVDFSPQQTGTYSGAVEFTISDPASPHQVVPLSGSGGESCVFIQPGELDFATVGVSDGQSCTSPETRQFVVINGCAQTVTIQSATVGGAAFSLAPGQTPQTLLTGAASAPFVVGFSPVSPGTFDGNVLVQTDAQQGSIGLGLSGSASRGKTLMDVFPARTAQVDVLWVVDTNDSASERDIVATQSSVFIDAMNKLNLDYRIGVTSDDTCENQTSPPPGAEEGRLLPCPGCKIDGQQPLVITPQDPTAAADLQYLLEIGANTGASISNTCSPDKQLFNAAFQASVGFLAEANEWNGPLVRPNTYLAIITVNGDDSDDNSLTALPLGSDVTAAPQWFASQLLSVNGASHPGLLSWSYLNPSGFGVEGGLQAFGDLPDRIQSMLTLVGGIAVDSTQTNWTDGLNGLWNGGLASITQFKLSGIPDPTSIVVYADGPPPDQTKPGGQSGVLITETDMDGMANWTYDPASNTLTINNDYLVLANSDTLYVEYSLGCPAAQ